LFWNPSMNMMNLQEQEFDAGILTRQVPISKI